MIRSAVPILLALAASSLAAQGVVVPAAYASADAPGRTLIPGPCAHQREQVLIDATRVTGLAGRTITGVWFRRDAAYPAPLQSATAEYEVWLSVTPRDPQKPSETFAQNRGNQPTRVFRGRLALPPAPAGTSIPWDEQHALHIPFTAPFPYAGGHLCLELTGTPVSPPRDCFWPVDGIYSDAPGTLTVVGQPCGYYAQGAEFTAFGQPRSLRVGSTAILTAWAQPGTSGSMLMAATLLGSPLLLAPFGAGGCSLYLLPVTSVPVSFTRTPQGDGLAQVSLPLPVNPALLRAAFHVQWLDVETNLPRPLWSNSAGLSLSNAVTATISPKLPDLGMSVVRTPGVRPDEDLPALGIAEVSLAPVIRFDRR